MRTRFAPSPTGYLHVGHALAAWEAFAFAHDHMGECLLRIEDIDHTRCKPDYTDAIYEDLSWLGLNWPKPVRVQSAHIHDHQKTLSWLAEMGLIYRCFKTRKELTLNKHGLYRGTTSPDEAERLAKGESFAWRLSIEKAKIITARKRLTFTETGLNPGLKTVDLDELSDEIIARKDIGTSYYLACTHDDAAQNITHIVRGEDIAPLTGFQVLLQTLMGWPTPVYHHHRVVRNTKGEKLSKRNKDTTLRALREKGYTAAQVLAMAGT